MADELPTLLLPDVAAWHQWLEDNHDSCAGVWLVLHTKGGTVTGLTYVQAVEEVLCFGWIDGQAQRRDEQSSMQRMTPRRARSPWSQRNVERVAQLEQEGRMREAGWAQVIAAQADGRWDRAYAGPATAEVPEDLASAIAAVPEAQAMFDVLTSTNRFALIYRVQGAKRPETRARRITAFVEMLTRGETPFPQKRRPEGVEN